MKKKLRLLLEILIVILGNAMYAFSVVAFVKPIGLITGGTTGIALFINKLFGGNISIFSFAINFVLFLCGFFVLGKGFILLSAAAGIGFSLIYGLLELRPPIYPAIAGMPFLAAVLGALFIGVGVGLCVRVGAAPGGDDALAMGVNKLTGMKLKWFYLISDSIVLGLSLSYIPLGRIMWSLLTVVLSGQIIDIIAIKERA